jgi:superfamily II DNA helicase RecQ
LFEVLRRWRLEEANREGHAAFHIFTQKALIGIANNLPKTEEELLQIHGIGKKKVEKYGAMVLEIIQNIKISDS